MVRHSREREAHARMAHHGHGEGAPGSGPCAPQHQLRPIDGRFSSRECGSDRAIGAERSVQLRVVRYLPGMRHRAASSDDLRAGVAQPSGEETAAKCTGDQCTAMAIGAVVLCA